MNNDLMNIPLVVEVTMYKNNINDNRILSAVKRETQLTKIKGSETNFFVSRQEIQEILETNFLRDIQSQIGMSLDELKEGVNSTFFLHHIVNSFEDLKFVKFNVSNKEDYTRLVGDEIRLEYKILHAKIDLPSLVDSNSLKKIQSLLKDMKFWEDDIFMPQTYIEVSAGDLAAQLTIYESLPEFNENHIEAIGILFSCIDEKLEVDNSTVHIVVME